MSATTGAADGGGRRARLRQQAGRRDDRRGGDRSALLFLKPLAEEGGREDLVPTFERSLARAVSLEERLQRVDRLGELVAEAARPRVVRPARDVVARG